MMPPTSARRWPARAPIAPAPFVKLKVTHEAAAPVESGSIAMMDQDASLAPPEASRMPPEQNTVGVKKVPGMSCGVAVQMRGFEQRTGVVA